MYKDDPVPKDEGRCEKEMAMVDSTIGKPCRALNDTICGSTPETVAKYCCGRALGGYMSKDMLVPDRTDIHKAPNLVVCNLRPGDSSKPISCGFKTTIAVGVNVGDPSVTSFYPADGFDCFDKELKMKGSSTKLLFGSFATLMGVIVM